MAQHPGSDYYVQPTTGTIQQQDNSFLAAGLKAAGFQGPMTWDQAQTVLALGKKVTQQYGPNAPTSTGGTISQTGADVKGTATAAWDAATAIPRFLSMLTSSNLWIRVGEVVAGLILLGIGVNALFKGAPMKTVTKTAGKVAPLALAA
jgi:hypothetical protein